MPDKFKFCLIEVYGIFFPQICLICSCFNPWMQNPCVWRAILTWKFRLYDNYLVLTFLEDSINKINLAE